MESINKRFTGLLVIVLLMYAVIHSRILQVEIWETMWFYIILWCSLLVGKYLTKLLEKGAIR